jgi:hypothetical protein
MAGQAKPSTLLARSLALFKSGKRWVQSEEEVTPGGTGRVRGKNHVEFPDGAFCAIGAVREVNTDRESEAAHYLALVIDPERMAGGGDAESVITEWNDDNKRSFGQVKKMFQKAIKLAKSLGQ